MGEMSALFAQAVGLAAMGFNILSYQQKTRRGVIGFQLCGSLLFALNFFLLGAPMGCILNIISAIRAVVFINRDKLRANHPAWLAGFLLTYLASYLLTFTVLGKDPTAVNLILEFLPVIGMTAATLSFRKQDAASIRRYGLISSPCWLIYNCTVPSTGGIICEVFNIISIIVGLIRYRKPKA